MVWRCPPSVVSWGSSVVVGLVGILLVGILLVDILLVGNPDSVDSELVPGLVALIETEV